MKQGTLTTISTIGLGVTVYFCLVIFLQANNTYAQQPELIVQTAHSEVINSITYSPDGKILASGSLDKTIKLWETTSGTILRTLSESVPHTEPSSLGPESRTVIAFSPRANILAGGNQDNSITLWDTSLGKGNRLLKGHSGSIFSLAFSPDGRLLASGSSDKTIRIWDVETGRLIRSIERHKAGIFFIAFTPDGNKLVSVGRDNEVFLWNPMTGKREQQSYTERSSSITSAALSSDGEIIAIGLEDSTIKLWNTKTGKIGQKLDNHNNHVTTLSFSPDGRFFGQWELR